uniref:Ubiquitin E3 ligase ICP0 n=1 Tax=Human herpesvirus 2 TaxID=10310 RepID=A0A0Y0R3G9_HHV2|nr:ubiquitin E3 ligase ICP0 [Human alphaherpesvirus 2]
MEPRPGTSSRADPGPERPPRQTPGTVRGRPPGLTPARPHRRPGHRPRRPCRATGGWATGRGPCVPPATGSAGPSAGCPSR